jgi:glutathionylspermidine synthase
VPAEPRTRREAREKHLPRASPPTPAAAGELPAVIRESRTPRANWREDCEAVGFSFHSMDGVYWDESHCYRFTADEIDELEAATRELHQLSLAAVDHIVATGRFEQLAIAPGFAERITTSWKSREPAIAGRFDLAYDGSHPPKLLEYNADTPTALLEASVVQWRWLQGAILPQQADADQFNSLHEKLIANWRAIGVTTSANVPVHFACVKESDEDFGTIEYQRDVATQAGITTHFVYIEDIGWADDAQCFVDGDGQEIDMLCKLYPWEWLIKDEFGPHLLLTKMRVIEPPWKMLLSTKGLLPILWEQNPGHPNLLAASFDRFRISGDYVQKPMYSREGANVTIYRGGEVLRENGSYGQEGWIYQAYTEIPRFDDSYVTIGSWIVGDEPAGIGLREDSTPITRNTSRFVPHYFV